jgi:hypothetical protein
MRTICTMVVGGLLTLTGLYVHDVLATGIAPRGATASPQRAIVNWNVAVSEASMVGENAHTAWLGLEGALQVAVKK